MAYAEVMTHGPGRECDFCHQIIEDGEPFAQIGEGMRRENPLIMCAVCVDMLREQIRRES